MIAGDTLAVLEGRDAAVYRGDPVALTEKGLRRPVLPILFAIRGLGILDVLMGLRSGCRELTSTSMSGGDMAKGRRATTPLHTM